MCNTFKVHRDHTLRGEILSNFPLLQEVSIANSNWGFNHIVQYTETLLGMILNDLKIR